MHAGFLDVCGYAWFTQYMLVAVVQQLYLNNRANRFRYGVQPNSVSIAVCAGVTWL